MALSVARPKHRSLGNPYLIHLFSTSPSPNDQDESDNNNNDTAKSQSQFASYFSDVKATLRQQQQQHQTPNQYFNRQLPQQQESPVFNKPTKTTSLEEIRKNLSEFRRRSSAPPPTDPNAAPPQYPSKPHVSFQELYKRNVISKSENAAGGVGAVSGKLSFDAIKKSLEQMRKGSPVNPDHKGRGPISLDAFRNSLRSKPSQGGSTSSGSTVIGGTGGLPFSVLGKEMEGGKDEKEREAMKTEFVKMYSLDELGQKLRSLRPGDGVKDFSLNELNERLAKLREIEEKEAASRAAGVSFKDLRDAFSRLKMADEEKAKRTTRE